MLVRHNAAEQSTVLWMRILAAEAGPIRSKVILVDPRRPLTVSTETGLHLQLRPGFNVALLNGLCHLLIEKNTIDSEFIDNHTVKFDQFRTLVSQYARPSREDLRRSTDTAADSGRMDRAVQDRCDTCLQGHCRGVCREQHAPADGQDWAT